MGNGKLSSPFCTSPRIQIFCCMQEHVNHVACQNLFTASNLVFNKIHRKTVLQNFCDRIHTYSLHSFKHISQKHNGALHSLPHRLFLLLTQAHEDVLYIYSDMGLFCYKEHRHTLEMLLRHIYAPIWRRILLVPEFGTIPNYYR